MSAKAINVKMDENKILDIKSIANVFHMTMTEVISEALDEYLAKMKKDPFYRLTANIQDASEDEMNEVLESLDALTDDDLMISQKKVFKA